MLHIAVADTLHWGRAEGDVGRAETKLQAAEWKEVTRGLGNYGCIIMDLSIPEENPHLCHTSYHSIFTSNLQISKSILIFYTCPPCFRYKNISEQMWSDHFPINRDLNYHIYPFYFFWKVFRGCVSMTSLPKDLHLKGCCSNLIHIWHNVFSCRTLPCIRKSVFSSL